MSRLVSVGMKNQSSVQPKVRLHGVQEMAVRMKKEKDTSDLRRQQIQGATSAAAVFNRSQLSDYNEKRLSGIQKSIMNLQEKITKIQNDDKMDSDTKDKLLETLDELLKAMSEKLHDETAQEDSADESQKQPTQNEPLVPKSESDTQHAQLTQTVASLISADLDMAQLKTLHMASAEIKAKATVAQRDLDFYVHHPAAKPKECPLVLKDGKLIEKRQGEIDRMEDIVEAMQKDAGQILARQMPAANAEDAVAARGDVQQSADEATRRRTKDAADEKIENDAIPQQEKAEN